MEPGLEAARTYSALRVRRGDLPALEEGGETKRLERFQFHGGGATDQPIPFYAIESGLFALYSSPTF